MWGLAQAEIAQDSFKFQGSDVSHTDAEFCRGPARFLLLMDHLSASPMPNHYLCTVQQNPMVTYNNNQQPKENLSCKHRSGFIRRREFLVTPINLLGSDTVVSQAADLPQKLWSHFWEIKSFCSTLYLSRIAGTLRGELCWGRAVWENMKTHSIKLVTQVCNTAVHRSQLPW